MKQHVAALDGLRGVAVAVVVAYHLRPEWVPGGFLGVDLFFVLSGYLITSLLLDERVSTGHIDLLAFAGRRLRRLLPAVLVMVAAIAVYISSDADLGEIDRVRRHGLATLAYIANWVFISDGDSYFADVAGPSLFRHVWSLAIEEQFYLAWPGLVWLAFRLGGRRGVGGTALALSVVSAVWMAVLHTGGDPSRVYFGTDTRIFEPLIGALVAVVLPLRAAKPPVVARIGVGAALAWIAAVLVVDDGWGGFYEGGAVALALLAAVLVLAAGTDGVVATVLAWRPLVGLGAISYAVYLWHWPILIILRREGWSGAGLDVTVVLATIGISTASLWLVEAPVRRRNRAVGWRPVGIAALAILAAAGTVAGFTRTSVPAEAVTVDEALAAVRIDEAEERGPDEEAGPITVALIGDSSAWTLGGGPIKLSTDHGPYTSPFDPSEITLLNLARKGYRLVPGATVDFGEVRIRPPDDLSNEAWWRATIAETEPDLVIALFGLSDIQSREVEGVPVDFDSPEFASLLGDAARVLLGDLAGIAPVLILTSPPLLGADMPEPVMSAFLSEFSDSRTARLNALLTGVAAADDRISIVDFGARLCPGGEGADRTDGCLLADGSPARFDGVHFTSEGGELAASLLREPLLAAAGAAPS